MGFLKEERETHIFTDDTMDYYIIETRQRTMLNKLKKLEKKKVAILLDKIEEKNEINNTNVIIQAKYKIPLKAIILTKPRDPRELTEEQKAQLRENFRKNVIKKGWLFILFFDFFILYCLKRNNYENINYLKNQISKKINRKGDRE